MPLIIRLCVLKSMTGWRQIAPHPFEAGEANTPLGVGVTAMAKMPNLCSWMKAMAGRGFIAPTWPTIYGGAGLGEAEACVLAEELRSISAPPAINSFRPVDACTDFVRIRHGAAAPPLPSAHRAR